MVLITIVHGVYKPTNTTGGPHMAPHCRGYDQSSSIVVLICRAMAELLVTALLSSCWLTSACSNPSEHRQLQEEMPPAPQRGFEKWILDPSGNQTWWKIHGKILCKMGVQWENHCNTRSPGLMTKDLFLSRCLGQVLWHPHGSVQWYPLVN